MAKAGCASAPGWSAFADDLRCQTRFRTVVPDFLAPDQFAGELEAVDEADAGESDPVRPLAVEAAENVHDRSAVRRLAEIATLDMLGDAPIAPGRTRDDGRKVTPPGLPISAVSGSYAAMEALSSGRLMHRGTFNGNPLSVAAAIACLEELRDGRNEIYARMDAFAGRLCCFLNDRAALRGVPVRARQAGAALQIFAAEAAIETLRDTAQVDKENTLLFTGALLREGVLTLPRGLCYLSAAHSLTDIEATEAAIAAAVDAVAHAKAA